MSIYPRPCDTCSRCETCIDGYFRSCDRWLTWWRWWWKQFNAYAEKYGIEPTTTPKTEKGNDNND